MSSDWRVAPTNSSDLLHKEFKVSLADMAGRCRGHRDPARVGELLDGGIEGFDNAIGEENERIARLK